MKCDECKFCILQDTGYSNWTVDGTDVSCFLDMNSSFPIDYWYGKTVELDFANICPRFKVGEPIQLDVDHDYGHLLNYVDDPEIRAILEKQVVWEILSS